MDWVKIESVDDMNVSVLDNKWRVNPCWGPSCEQFMYFWEEITNEAPKVYRQRSLRRNKIKGAEGWLWEKTLERAAWSSVGDALRNGPKGSWWGHCVKGRQAADASGGPNVPCCPRASSPSPSLLCCLHQGSGAHGFADLHLPLPFSLQLRRLTSKCAEPGLGGVLL